MIVAKLQDNTYLTDTGAKVMSKVAFENEKASIESIEEPTDNELIELGKQMHTFYQKELILKNIDDNLKEIEEYEAKLSGDNL